MSLFDRYARYYDLLYQDKGYDREARFIRAVLERYGFDRGFLLDLGCGTGRHALVLAELGYTVVGVDRSPRMIAEGQRRRSELRDKTVAERLVFAEADVRSLRREETFDAVVSLFHVISYQVGNDDLFATFATVRRHLAPGGVFVFDCWYGPAVLVQRPQVRIKRMADSDVSVFRAAEPRHLPNENRVDVHFDVLVSEHTGLGVERFQEVHAMRYLFRPEVEFMLQVSGFELLGGAEWLTDRPLDESTWNAYFVARAVEPDSTA